MGKRVLSRHLRQKAQRSLLYPPLGYVRFGNLRRRSPISRRWGFDRGQPIDRYYIENFLSRHASEIKGSVLEIKDNSYTMKYGDSRVTRIDVLHKIEGNPKATIVADLTSADHLPGDTYDCIICTQTLQFIYDVKAAVKTLHRLLKPNGVLLVTIPSITKISRDDMDQWGDYWRFTSFSTRLLFEEVFSKSNITVSAYGNIFSAIAFLHGLASEELDPKELDHRDPDYELLITVRALKT
jgi:SAM-dependent methyltransferase